MTSKSALALDLEPVVETPQPNKPTITTAPPWQAIETNTRSDRLKDKVILITGGTSGLGAESAIALARHNPARIYIAGRREQAAQDVIERIRREADEDGDAETQWKRRGTATEVIFLPMDLADLSSVSAAADNNILHPQGPPPRLDILLCNAGIAAVPYALTRDGHEIQMGTNHLGHALLVRKLMPLLREGAGGGGRVVSVTSLAYRAGVGAGVGLGPAAAAGVGEMDEKMGGGSDGGGGVSTGVGWRSWDAFGLGAVTRWLRYGESKLANVVYTRELARRYPEVVSVCVNPGFVETGMVSGMRLCDRIGTRLLAGVTWIMDVVCGAGEGRGPMVTPEQGAENQVWACLVGNEALKNGGLYDPVGGLCREERMSARAVDRRFGERLWGWTEEQVGSWL